MATSPVEVIACAGRSGGAVGSSQSPNWKPPSQTRVGPANSRQRSTHAFALGYCRRTVSASPRRRSRTSGTITAASPHAAAGRAMPMTSGTTNGTVPSAACSSARSRSHESRNPRTSYRKAAVGAKTWMSPVQPKRSSRCGQSVGIETTLPRRLHTTLSCRRCSNGCDVRNEPVRSRSLCTTTAVTAPSGISPGHPETSAYRKPWNVNSGSHTSVPVPASV